MPGQPRVFILVATGICAAASAVVIFLGSLFHRLQALFGRQKAPTSPSVEELPLCRGDAHTREPFTLVLPSSPLNQSSVQYSATGMDLERGGMSSVSQSLSLSTSQPPSSPLCPGILHPFNSTLDVSMMTGKDCSGGHYGNSEDPIPLSSIQLKPRHATLTSAILSSYIRDGAISLSQSAQELLGISWPQETVSKRKSEWWDSPLPPLTPTSNLSEPEAERKPLGVGLGLSEIVPSAQNFSELVERSLPILTSPNCSPFASTAPCITSTPIISSQSASRSLTQSRRCPSESHSDPSFNSDFHFYSQSYSQWTAVDGTRETPLTSVTGINTTASPHTSAVLLDNDRPRSSSPRSKATSSGPRCLASLETGYSLLAPDNQGAASSVVPSSSWRARRGSLLPRLSFVSEPHISMVFELGWMAPSLSSPSMSPASSCLPASASTNEQGEGGMTRVDSSSSVGDHDNSLRPSISAPEPHYYEFYHDHYDLDQYRLGSGFRFEALPEDASRGSRRSPLLTWGSEAHSHCTDTESMYSEYPQSSVHHNEHDEPGCDEEESQCEEQDDPEPRAPPSPVYWRARPLSLPARVSLGQILDLQETPFVTDLSEKRETSPSNVVRELTSPFGREAQDELSAQSPVQPPRRRTRVADLCDELAPLGHRPLSTAFPAADSLNLGSLSFTTVSLVTSTSCSTATFASERTRGLSAVQDPNESTTTVGEARSAVVPEIPGQDTTQQSETLQRCTHQPVRLSRLPTFICLYTASGARHSFFSDGGEASSASFNVTRGVDFWDEGRADESEGLHEDEEGYQDVGTQEDDPQRHPYLAKGKIVGDLPREDDEHCDSSVDPDDSSISFVSCQSFSSILSSSRPARFAEPCSSGSLEGQCIRT
ncbi:hypothetical protein CC2G_011148 [Coprinopsis cinerea AmutBmut pab1-1]|nr:hypothetical protein CC2G_011148 [Coprinopsis cinerea AmutBmut pab1-1]KAG2014319.1 hypothetical protein CC2G_011148 [Coprinopsis cinerea AmutBmut pab1-1]